MKIKKKYHGKKGIFVFSGFSLELMQQRGHCHHCLKIFWGAWGVARWGSAQFSTPHNLETVMHAYSPSIRKMKAGGSEAQG